MLIHLKATHVRAWRDYFCIIYIHISYVLYITNYSIVVVKIIDSSYLINNIINSSSHSDPGQSLDRMVGFRGMRGWADDSMQN